MKEKVALMTANNKDNTSYFVLYEKGNNYIIGKDNKEFEFTEMEMIHLTDYLSQRFFNKLIKEVM